MERLQIQDVDIELFYNLCTNETNSFLCARFTKAELKKKDYGLPFLETFFLS